MYVGQNGSQGALEVMCRGGVDWDRSGDPTALMLEVGWIGKDLGA